MELVLTTLDAVSLPQYFLTDSIAIIHFRLQTTLRFFRFNVQFYVMITLCNLVKVEKRSCFDLKYFTLLKMSWCLVEAIQWFHSYKWMMKLQSRHHVTRTRYGTSCGNVNMMLMTRTHLDTSMFFKNAIWQHFMLATGPYQPNSEMNKGTVKQTNICCINC